VMFAGLFCWGAFLGNNVSVLRSWDVARSGTARRPTAPMGGRLAPTRGQAQGLVVCEGRACEFGADDGVLRPLGRVASSARPAPEFPVMPEACLRHDEGACAGFLAKAAPCDFGADDGVLRPLGRGAKRHGPRLTFPSCRRHACSMTKAHSRPPKVRHGPCGAGDGALGLTSVALQHRQIKHPIPQQTARFPEYTESAARVSCPSDVRPNRRSRRVRPRRWSRGSISASWGPWWSP